MASDELHESVGDRVASLRLSIARADAQIASLTASKSMARGSGAVLLQRQIDDWERRKSLWEASLRTEIAHLSQELQRIS